MKIVILWTDAVVYLVLATVLLYAFKAWRTPHLAATWRKAFIRPSGTGAAIVLTCFVGIGLVDSIHYRSLLPGSQPNQPIYAPETRSFFDDLMAKQAQGREGSYSAPLAFHAYEKTAVTNGTVTVRDYARLKFGGAHLAQPEKEWGMDVCQCALSGFLRGVLLAAGIATLAAGALARSQGMPFKQGWATLWKGDSEYPLRTVVILLGTLALFISLAVALSSKYHVFGTDRVGNDLEYVVLKSIRTALVIGTMSTLVTMPIAVGLGILAGYLRGFIDEAIQYVYTVVNSIPYVLMIAAMVLILMGYIDNHPDVFQTSAERTDARLFFLCVILGMTSWTDLCRLIRGEVIKLREAEYIQAARAFGVGTWRILSVHLLPNVMHLILVSIVINFSGLVLAEAVLSYVGIGVDPAMQSFGTLINTARLELSREPAIWWTLATAFTFMFTLVLAANILADAIRDAFDPRTIHR
jgi:peptide/nickel transport system permease protein